MGAETKSPGAKLTATVQGTREGFVLNLTWQGVDLARAKAETKHTALALHILTERVIYATEPQAIPAIHDDVCAARLGNGQCNCAMAVFGKQPPVMWASTVKINDPHHDPEYRRAMESVAMDVIY